MAKPFNLKKNLRQLQAEGEQRAILILDAAYEFSVSVGVYASVKGGKYDLLAGAALG